MIRSTLILQKWTDGRIAVELRAEDFSKDLTALTEDERQQEEDLSREYLGIAGNDSRQCGVGKFFGVDIDRIFSVMRENLTLSQIVFVLEEGGDSIRS